MIDSASPAASVPSFEADVVGALRMDSPSAATRPKPPTARASADLDASVTAQPPTLPWLSRPLTRKAYPWPCSPRNTSLVVATPLRQSDHEPPSVATWTSKPVI